MGAKQLIKNTFNKFGYEIKRVIPQPVHEQSGNVPFEQLVQIYGPDIVQYMAVTGAYTNECMERGFLPVQAHFYQPIPNLKDLEERNVWKKISAMKGIEWDESRFLQNLQELSEYSDECDWPNEPTDSPLDFHINNTSFSYGCASALHSIIRKHRPCQIIEVGSGNSSKVIAAAIFANINENQNCSVEYTIIDPYSDVNPSLFPKGTTLIQKPVECIDVNYFSRLKENDILFIDSSHVSKIGSDVNFLVLDVLPDINSGVFVHFHDIELPNEYSRVYAHNPTFRMFWTEAYLLQAFLSENRSWEIFLPLSWTQRNHASLFREYFPKGNEAVLWGSSSFWIRSI